MNKIKYLIICLIVLMFPVSAKALTGGMTLSCPSQAKPGDTVNCTIKGTSSSVIMGFKTTVTVNGPASITSVTKASDKWNKVEIINGNTLNGYPENTDITGNFDVGTLTLKINDNATAGTVTVKLGDEVMFTDYENDYADVTEGITGGSASINVVVETEPPEPAAKGLKSLSPIGGTLGPQFISTTEEYLLTIPGNATTFGLTAVANESSDQVVFYAGEARNAVSDPSNITFATESGKTQMLVYIEVGSGDRKVTYTIFVQKNISTGDANELASLKVGDQTVPLMSGVYDDYTVVLNDVSSYEVVADLKDREHFEIRHLNSLSPRSGTGEFSIIIDPKDSSSGLGGVTYTINVIKGGTTPPASSSTPRPSSSSHIVNPPTGGMASVIMALVLMASFGVSVYYYKKNASYLNK